ncbi:MAG: hypothetical protein WB439_07005 [Acidobacteriaceae bacterium]
MAAETHWRLAEIPEGKLSRTKHTLNGEPMPSARHIILAEHSDGPMVYRYSEDWIFAGDTWHENIADALHQIDFEFGVSKLHWQTISEQQATLLMSKPKASS